MLLNLTLDNPVSLIISLIVILVFVSDVINGYKKGFLGTAIKLFKSVVALLFAYLFKGKLATYLSIHLPFFNLQGLFKGLDIVNVLIYELIAFVAIFAIVSLILKIIIDLFNIEERLFSLIVQLGIPNNLIGAIFGGLKSIIIIYFALSIFFVVSNFMKIDTGNSLGDYVVNMPILKNSFGGTLDSFDQISELAVEYENTQDKGVLNHDAIGILLENGIISEEQLNALIDAGKVEYSMDNIEAHNKVMEELYESFFK